MKIINKTLLDMEGNPLMAGDVSLTVAKVLVNVALAPEPTKDPNRPPVPLSADEQRKWWEFALTLHRVGDGESFEITAEQIVKVKERLPHIYNPIITGQMAALLEGAH